MAGTYTLELELFSLLNASTSNFEIWADGALLGGYSSTVSSAGSTISISVPYGGLLPSSLEFRFNDAAPGSVDTIEIRSVKINDRYVNTNNYLSGTTLNDGGSQTVSIGSNDYLFDASEPTAGDFLPATQTFTAGDNFYRNYTTSTDQVFDMLGGRDTAILGSGNDRVAGGAGDDVLYGYGGNDLLYGGADNDRLYGGDGNDTLYGGDGNDRIHGEAGDDEIHGGLGDDRLNGHAGNDIITGGDGADKISGGDDDDYLFGDAGDDQITGGNGNDTLDGGADNDLMYGGAGVDHMNGGIGNDIMIGDAGDDVMHGDDGNDLMYGLADNDTMYGGAGLDEIYGGDGNDTIDGGAGDDEILGGAGDDNLGGGDNQDTVWGNNGDDTINGGNDHDIIYGDGGTFAQGWEFAYYDLGSSPTTLATAGFTLNGGMDNTNAATSRGVSQIFDPAFYDTGDNYAIKYETYLTITTAGSYTFRTTSDDGSALFLDGVQIVNNDGLHGSVTVTSAAQVLAAGVYKLDATFFERTGGNIMNVQMSGPDTGSVFVSLDSYAAVNAANGAGSVASGNDIIDGGAGDDTIYGDVGADTITGGTGEDVIIGGAGVDIIDGGNDDDSLLLANGDFAAGESLTGGGGTDNITLTNATTVDFTTGTLATIETLNGSTGNDDVTYTIQQALGFSTINLGAGTDTSRVQVSGAVDVTVSGTPTVSNAEHGYLTGSAGADILTITGAQLDALIFGSGTINFAGGADTLNITSTSADLNSLGLVNASIQGLETISAATAAAGVTIFLSGQTEAFTITGSASADSITGGTGADTIDGGNGNDTINLANGQFAAGESLTGGGGTDNITLTNATTVNFTTGTLATIETLNGSTGNDIVTISGTQLNGFTTLSFNGGTDTLNITTTSTGLNALADGSLTGLENVSASTAAAGVTLSLASQTEGFTITGSAFNDTLTGSIGADTISGGTGADTIDGGNGNDTINLANGDFAAGESLTGNIGTDNITLTNATTVDFTTGTLATIETLNGSTGNDIVTMSGTQLNDFTSLLFNGGTDTLNITTTSTGFNALADGGLTGLENVSASTAAAGVTISLASQTEGFTITGSGFDDTLTGGSGNDTITGGNGDDIINGGNGTNVLYGNVGDDTITGGTGNDTIYALDNTVDTEDTSINVIRSFLVEEHFASGSGIFSYSDGGFGGSDGANVDVTGTHIGSDGNLANGALEVTVDGQNNSAFTNGSGTWDGSYTAGSNLSGVQVSFAFRHTHASANDAGEDSAVYFEFDGTIYDTAGGNSFLSQALGSDGATDTGWITVTIDLPDLVSGNTYNFSMGILHDGSNRSNEDAEVRFDDFYLIGGTTSGSAATAVDDADAAYTNVINGGAGSDTIYGSSGVNTLNGDAGNDTIYSASVDTAAAKIANILSNNAGVTYNSTTESFYQVVTTTVDWTVANAAATSATLTGLTGVTGHLTNITSAAEQAYVQGITGSLSTWLGGGDFNTEGVWEWIDGPESGTQFADASGNSVGGNYVNFAGGQPNDSNSTQNYLYMLNGGTWADLVNEGDGSTGYVTVDQYVIEWDASSIVNKDTILSGGDGLDTLYGNSGRDIFLFEAATAYNDLDAIENFGYTLDSLDLSDLLTGYNAATDDINDFVQITESGGNSTFAVDANGTAGGSSYSNVFVINGVTGMDLDVMEIDGTLIV
ncbi:MAG: PA14 domain-containing protein [Alphaproteobacteria bacterium]